MDLLGRNILHLLGKHGPLDCSQICVELLVADENGVRAVISSLVKSEQIEPRLDPGQAETTEFMRVPWGLSTGFRQKTREKRKDLARRILTAAS